MPASTASSDTLVPPPTITGSYFPPVQPQTMVIGISGCTSSGKSTFANLLKLVFDGAFIIHQDDFFQPKSLCPIDTFQATKDDARYVQNCLEENVESEYSIVVDADKEDTYHITGPDTDCNEAIDFMSIYRDIATFRNTVQIPRPSPVPAKMFALDNSSSLMKYEFDVSPYAALIAELQVHCHEFTRWHARRHNKKGRVDKWLRIDTDGEKKTIIAPTLCFVEGFLLYTDPSIPLVAEETLTPNTPFDWGTYRLTQYSLLQTIKDLYNNVTLSTSPALQANTNSSPPVRLFAPLPHPDPDYTSALESYKTDLWALNNEAKVHLQSLFDLKLYLPTSKPTAHKRRLGRKMYRDTWDNDGEREAGQLWKTEGYFESCVWRSVVECEGWLGLDGDEWDREVERSGVKVRPVVDAGVEETLRWAVKTILLKLSEKTEG